LSPGAQFCDLVVSVRGINIRDVRRVAVPFPTSLSEQRAIATALSDVDALLSGLDGLIAKTRDLKQAAIAAVLSDMDAELAALEARRNKTRALEQAMMQELLTGRTRLIAPGTAANTEVTA
jgi:restriction endonuclease S subunit